MASARPAHRYDVIVLGLGAMGSAATCHLAKAGCRVLGLDRYHPPHTFGSSHGQSRIIREAYFEHPSYVPLVQRAYELWADLENRTGRRLLTQTGGLMIGRPDGVVFRGAKASAEQHRLAYQNLTASDIRQRFPALQPDAEMSAVWEPRAGVLFPEACIESHLGLAAQNGAVLAFDEAVQSWQADPGEIRVTTRRATYHASQLLFTSGAWTQELLPELELPLQVERQVLFWFDAKDHSAFFEPDRCPIYIWEFAPGRYFYGFPNLGEGIKVAGHHAGDVTHPDQVDRQVRDSEVEAMRTILARHIPDANGVLRSTAVCLYTNTPDQHFLIDWHPAFPRRVLLASPCSGHGFKFSSAVGEVLKDLLLKGSSSFDLSLFRLDRFIAAR
jgi:sarcosine oxidase